MRGLVRFLKQEDGTTITNYAIISCMICLAAIGMMVSMSAKAFGVHF